MTVRAIPARQKNRTIKSWAGIPCLIEDFGDNRIEKFRRDCFMNSQI